MRITLTLISLCFLNALKEAFFLILAPFLPEQMKDKGIPDYYYAPIFTGYTLMFFITSVVIGKYSGSIGRPILLRLGAISQVIAAGCFIGINYIENDPLDSNTAAVQILLQLIIFSAAWISIAFVGRLIEGVGAGLIQTAAYGELMIQYADDQNKIVSLMEFSGVFGNMSGVLIASFLSYFLGFVGPFAVCGGLFLIFVIFLNVFVKFAKVEPEKEIKMRHNSSIISFVQPKLRTDQQLAQGERFTFVSSEADPMMSSGGERRLMSVSSQPKKNYHPIGYFEVMKNKRAIFALVSIMFSINLFSFVDTILADNLEKVFEMNSSIISIVYASQCFGFLLTSPFPHRLLEKFNSIEIMLVTMIIQVIACFMLGPSQIMHLPNYLWISIPGLILGGMSFPFTIVSAYQELYDAVVMCGKSYDPLQMNDTLVALFNSFFSLGLIIGPLAGSYITLGTNFRFCTDIEALVLLGFFTLYIAVVYLPMKIMKKPFKPILEKKAFSVTSSQQLNNFDAEAHSGGQKQTLKNNKYTLIDEDEKNVEAGRVGSVILEENRRSLL